MKVPYTTQSSPEVDVDVVGAGNWRATATVETRRLLFCSEVLKTWDNMVVDVVWRCGSLTVFCFVLFYGMVRAMARMLFIVRGHFGRLVRAF
jgi:hypothetical protein